MPSISVFCFLIAVPGTEPGASHMGGKGSTTESQPQEIPPLAQLFFLSFGWVVFVFLR